MTIFPGIRKKHLVSDNYVLDQWVSDSPLDYLPLVCGKFYDEYKFKKAGWNDVKSVFEKVSGRNLSDFFKVYIYDTKIPEIIIKNVLISSNSVSFDISSTFSLNQKIPLYIYFKNENYTFN